MTTQLEQSLLDLCNREGLESAGLTLMTPGDLGRTWFHVDLQWRANGARNIATSNADTIAQALGNALSEMAAKRSTAEPTVIGDEYLIAQVAA